MKKIWIFVSTITLLAMFTATVNVMAGPASSDPLRSALKPTKTPRVKPTKTPRVKNAKKNYQGSIVAVSAGSLTLTLKDGSSPAFVLTGDTKIKITGLGHNATLADLTVGDSATVHASQDETGLLVATSVDVKRAKPKPEHYSGTVTDYQPGASITIQDKEGASLTFLVTADTKIKFGSKDDTAALAVGSEVNIAALRDSAGGTSTASEIKVQKKKPVNYQGSIAAVDAGSLTLTLKDGSSLAFVLNEDTKIKITGLGPDATFADLTVGDSAAVRASEDETGGLVASSVEVKLPKPKHYTGTVTDYQPGASITIQDKEGASLTFLITADTKIKFGRKDGKTALEVGSEVNIAALRESAGGTPTASEIKVHKKKPVNYEGSIAAVDAGSLTLTLKDGSSLAFVLDADTKVKIPGLGREATLADLAVGDDVKVRASEDETGLLVASSVELKHPKPEHYSGTVTDYQPGASITILDKEGASLTFLITADTKIKFGRKDDKNALAVGSEVNISALPDFAGGTPTAKEISVHKKKPENYQGSIAAFDASQPDVDIERRFEPGVRPERGHQGQHPGPGPRGHPGGPGGRRIRDRSSSFG